MKKIFILLGVALLLFANNNGRHFANQTVVAGESIKLSLTVDHPAQKTVYLHYRTNGADLFKAVPLRQAGYDFAGKVTIPEEGYTRLEYYFSVVNRYGAVSTEPAFNPEANPYTSRIIKYSQDANIIYEIISPFEGEEVEQDDFMVALSLLSVPADVNLKLTKLLFDGVNVTSFAEIEEEIITWVPVNRLKTGTHNLEVEFYDNTNKQVKKISWSFSITGDEEAGSASEYSSTENVRLFGTLDFNTSSQSYGNSGADPSSEAFTNTSFTVGGNLYWLDFDLYGLVSSEQKDFRQDVDRFSANLRLNLFWDMYLKLQLGDFTPDYNQYMISGQNMNGVGASVVTGLVNLEFATGQNRKEIAPVQDGNGVSDYTDLKTQNQSFQRDFTAGRFSIGNRESGFAIGLNFLQSEDKTFEADSTWDISPEANIVVGPDFTLGFMNNRIKFGVGYLVSIKNENIRGEPLPLDIINDRFGADLDQSLYDNINEFFPMTGIPLAATMFYTTADWNYSNLLFKLRYENIDANFKNHGNPYIQDDVKRVIANTTLRLFDNSVYLRASYASTEDNQAGKLLNTTGNDVIGFGVDWYPDPKYPSVSLNFNNQDQAAEDTLGTETGDYTNSAFDVRVSQGYNIAGYELTSSVLVGSGTGESKLNPTLGSETSNFLVNTSAKLPFMPLKVFAEISNFESITTDINESKTTNFRLSGTYEIISREDLSLSGFAQYINSGTDITDLVADATTEVSQNSIEFGGNFGYDLTQGIALSSYISFRNLSISTSIEDYSNSYFNFGTTISF